MKEFHDRLKNMIDEYVHLVYRITRNFPSEEKYGITSQFRRAAVSVILNYIEGYARSKDKVHLQFLETSYGSLKESEYLIDFCYKEKYINNVDYEKTSSLANEIGGMLWGTISGIKKKIK